VTPSQETVAGALNKKSTNNVARFVLTV